MFDVCQENIGIGGLLDRHRCDHAAQAHSAKDRHDLPVAARRCLMDASTPGTPRIEPSHRSSDATFVKENQSLRRDRLDARHELFASLTVGFGVPLDRME